MNKYLNRLKVLRNLKDDKTVLALLEYYDGGGAEAYDNLLYEIFAAGAEKNFVAAVQSAVLRDENAFSVACAEGAKISNFLKQAYLDDLAIIFAAIRSLSGKTDFNYGTPLPLFDCGDNSLLIYNLEDFYRKNGYGQLIGGKAFEFGDGKFTPLSGMEDITFAALKNYAGEKALIENNVKNFLENLPFSHMLLYGDRGTGKSSTVHALLNTYADKGLRLIELGRDEIKQIKIIKQKVARLQLKFILFIDDLSFDERSGSANALKTAVEGSVVYGNNVMVVATSNRRHIINEKFSERENSVHPADSMEEQLSLSDRFGLTVMFSSTDKAGYLSIVDQLADDRKITLPKDELHALAERWAVVNGGRSPRRAKQFTDFVFACQSSGRNLNF